jgi:hypothetical protein
VRRRAAGSSRRRSPSTNVLSLTVDSREGAGMRVCTDAADRDELERLVRDRNTAQKVALRLDQVRRRNPGRSRSRETTVRVKILGSHRRRHQTLFERAMLFPDSHIFFGDWRTACSALSGSADCAAWLRQIYSVPLIDTGAALAPGLIVATDTTFSSNRFAWTHQVPKLDFKSN